MPYRVVETDAQLTEKPGTLLASGTDSAVPRLMETTIATLAAGSKRNLTEIYCSSDTPATWRLKLNGSPISVVRTSDRWFHWDFNAFGIADTDVVTVTVFLHCNRLTGEADVSIIGYVVT